MNSLAKPACHLFSVAQRCVWARYASRVSSLLPTQWTKIEDQRNASKLGLSVPRAGVQLPMILCRGMAGHSKWQNIRHIKSAKDDIKKKNSEKIVRRIKVAIQEGGSSDPKFNARLASALQAGKELNVPNATMDNAIKGIEKARAAGKQLYVEAIGPGNFQFIVETFTEKQKWSRQELTRVCKRYGAKLGDAGFASHSFDKKGIAQSPLVGDEADMDAAMDAAIEAGAEDVVVATDDDDQNVLQFVCDPADLHIMKTNLENLNYKISASRLEYVPSLFVTISPETAELADKFFMEIEELEFVIRIYDNIEVSES